MAQQWEAENGEEGKHGSSHPSHTTRWVSCFKANHVPMLTHALPSSARNNNCKERSSADSTRTIPPNRKTLEEHCTVQNMSRPFLLSWSPKQCRQWLFTQHWHGISYKWSRDDLQNTESWTWGLRPVNSGTWRRDRRLRVQGLSGLWFQGDNLVGSCIQIAIRKGWACVTSPTFTQCVCCTVCAVP